MIGVMPDTRGRGPGEDGQNLKGAVDAAAARYQVEPSLRRAVCRESGLHGSGRGGWKRTCLQITRWPPTSLTEAELLYKMALEALIYTLRTFTSPLSSASQSATLTAENGL
jgi:hypothetical protein